MQPITIILILVAYFIPWVVAGARHHNNRQAIAVTNLFLGWTVIGWIGALVWASTDNVKSSQ